MNSRELIVGQATQDHELAAIRETWNATDSDMQDEFVCFLESEEEDLDRAFLADLPGPWIEWIKQCACCGLRESILQAVGAEGGHL